LLLAALLLPAGPAAADHPDGTCLSLEQSSNTAEVGSRHTIASVLRFDGAKDCDGAVEDPHEDLLINLEIISGPHDNDDDDPNSPDFVCTIGDDDDTCQIDYQGTSAGRDVVRGWIAHTAPDSAEGVNQANSPGDTAEPDETDLVAVNWVVPSGTPATIDCDDSSGPDLERATLPLTDPGASEDYTCSVRDGDGALLSEALVKGENETKVNDPPDGGDDERGYSNPDYSCVTGSNGRCQIRVSPTDGDTGTTTICFYLDDGTSCGDEPIDEDEGNDRADRVELTWEARRAGRIEAEPETATNALGVEHQITVQVFDQFGRGYAGNSVEVSLEFYMNSPSDKDGNSPGSPDLNCKTASGSSNCSLKYTQNAASGVDLMCVYLKSAPPVMSGSNTTGTCDGDIPSETGDVLGSFEAPEAGDDQDVVQHTWQPGGLSMTPDFPTNRVGNCQAFTILLTDESGRPVQGAIIDLQQRHDRSADNIASNEPSTGYCMPRTGPNRTMVDVALGDLAPPFEVPDDKGTSGGETTEGTNAEGKVTIGVKVKRGQGSNGAGQAEVVAFLDSFDGDDDPDPEELVDRSFLTWVASSDVANLCRVDDAILGTKGPDTLTGTGRADIICGLGGDDILVGLGGRDILIGGIGDDTIRGNGGPDRLAGGRGNDILAGGKGNDVLDGGRGRDKCKPGPGNDKLFSCAR
jgi:hypothetical protein